MRAWTKENRIACFYFEAFDEQWKDMGEADGSENHFGLIDLQGRAKFPLWDEVDAGVFRGLTRGGVPISKTSNGNQASIEAAVLQIPTVSDLGGLAISTVNPKRRVGEVVTESKYLSLIHI